MDTPALLLSRLQFAFTMSFHIVYRLARVVPAPTSRILTYGVVDIRRQHPIEGGLPPTQTGRG
jgi:hypothetical protein